MKALQAVKVAVFNGIFSLCYAENDSPDCDLYLPREAIGLFLGYSNPNRAIRKIHKQHYQRLNRFSVKTVEGSRLYSTRGAWELCRYSEQPHMEDVMDFIWDIHHLWKGDINND